MVLDLRLKNKRAVAMTALCFWLFYFRQPDSQMFRESVVDVLSWCRKNFFKKNEKSVNLFTVWFVLKTSYYICTVFSWY